jgi:hypothetical protein
MCEMMVDLGNEKEMQALYKRQRRWLLPTLWSWAILFNVTAIVISIPRWSGGHPNENMDVLCAGLSMLFAITAIQQWRTPFEDWIKTMPRQPRIAGD